MRKDICFGDVDLASDAALADWNGMILAFLSHGMATPARLGAVLDREPGFAMGHAARGLFSLLMGRRELVDTARTARIAAEAALAQGWAPARARGWCAALGGWLDCGPSAAIAALEEVIAAEPRDTLSVKLCHAIRFILGDSAGMRLSLERVLDAHGDDHPCRGYLLGCHAFALEETGDYAAAERTGLRGLEAAPDDAWGLHAVAHVYDMTGQSAGGIALIERHDGAWMHCNNFRYHVWWHQALMHLDQGDTDRVLMLYDRKIRVDRTDDYRDIANATSLLARLELEGVNVGDRWAELADLAEGRSDDGCLVFADLHYMLALIGDRREGAAARLMSRMKRDAGPEGEVARIVADPGLGAAAGLAAFGEGDYGRAFSLLRAARPRMQSIGGSHAQRDVYERITVDAGIRAGHFDAAAAILAERRARRAGVEDAFAAARFAAIEAAQDASLRYSAE
jgi:tetratricopeptide (TPR) repeat protein